MQKTDWFPGSVKPVRSGVYERMYTYGKSRVAKFSHYSPRIGWGLGGATVSEALTFSWDDAPNQTLPWRGLTEKA